MLVLQLEVLEEGGCRKVLGAAQISLAGVIADKKRSYPMPSPVAG